MREVRNWRSKPAKPARSPRSPRRGTAGACAGRTAESRPEARGHRRSRVWASVIARRPPLLTGQVAATSKALRPPRRTTPSRARSDKPPGPSGPRGLLCSNSVREGAAAGGPGRTYVSSRGNQAPTMETASPNSRDQAVSTPNGHPNQTSEAQIAPKSRRNDLRATP